jgi:hypothetical protein
MIWDRLKEVTEAVVPDFKMAGKLRELISLKGWGLSRMPFRRREWLDAASDDRRGSFGLCARADDCACDVIARGHKGCVKRAANRWFLANWSGATAFTTEAHVHRRRSKVNDKIYGKKARVRRDVAA